ncbi:MAG: heat shock protein transcriptional repressor HspR [Actinomycetota bacterium]
MAAKRHGDYRRDFGGPLTEDRAVFIISVAADLAGVHPQTLRFYERRGLLAPKRTSGNSRRYSSRDVEMLRRIQRLTQHEGVNLAGVRIIMEMEAQIAEIRSQLELARRSLVEAEREVRRRTAAALARLTDVRNPFEESI